MIKQTNNDKPIIIGGLGGSGTRVIADILIHLNYFMGNDLNEALDNLSFTFLFKRPYIYFNDKSHEKIFKKSHHIFTNSMQGRNVNNPKNTLFLFKLLTYNFLKNHHQFNSNKEALDRLKKILKPKLKYNKYHKGWGWKEPNSHIFLNKLSNYYPEMKYIHVIRHGLDMAYSKNIEQLKNWHSVFDIKMPKKFEEIPVAQLEYWIRANTKAIDTAKQKFNKNFLLMNFDRLCINPEEGLKRIINFLGIDKDNETFEKLKKLPKIPKSKDRYMNYDISIFSNTQIEKVKNFGFQINLSI